MDNKFFTQLAGAFPGTGIEPHFDKISFRIKKKIFATLDEKKNLACLKLSKSDQEVFSSFDPTLIYPVPNKWGAQGWTFVDVEKTPENMLIEALTAAYCEISGKNQQRTAPLLSTAQLLLRPLQVQDEAALFTLRTDARVNQYIERSGDATMEDVRQFIEKIQKSVAEQSSFYWAITEKGHGDLIGTICFWNISENWKSAEIGFELLPNFQGKGLMQEALEAVLDCGFERLAFERITAFVAEENEKSLRILARCGFQEDPKQSAEANVGDSPVVYKVLCLEH